MDINPFPAHLTAVNLAMRNVRAPSTETNVIVDDFFNAEPGKLYPVRIKTAKGELTRTIVIPPELDVIIGNPPYTSGQKSLRGRRIGSSSYIKRR